MHASKISGRHLVLTVRRRRFVVGLEKIRCRFPLPPPPQLHTGRGPDEVDCALPLWGIHHGRRMCPTFNFCIGLLSSTMTPGEAHVAIATAYHGYSSSAGFSTRQNMALAFSCWTCTWTGRQVHFPLSFSRQYNFISIPLFSLFQDSGLAFETQVEIRHMSAFADRTLPPDIRVTTHSESSSS